MPTLVLKLVLARLRATTIRTIQDVLQYTLFKFIFELASNFPEGMFGGLFIHADARLLLHRGNASGPAYKEILPIAANSALWVLTIVCVDLPRRIGIRPSQRAALPRRVSALLVAVESLRPLWPRRCLSLGKMVAILVSKFGHPARTH